MSMEGGGARLQRRRCRSHTCFFRRCLLCYLVAAVACVATVLLQLMPEVTACPVSAHHPSCCGRGSGRGYSTPASVETTSAAFIAPSGSTTPCCRCNHGGPWGEKNLPSSFASPLASLFEPESTRGSFQSLKRASSVSDSADQVQIQNSDSTRREEDMFDDFADFLLGKQSEIISTLEGAEADGGGGATFSDDRWGSFLDENGGVGGGGGAAGGITRVMQNGRIIEKGAVSVTVLRNGTLSGERATAIRGRQGGDDVDGVGDVVKEGAKYSAAALSLVLHSRSPMVPTFRSDVRVFLVSGDDGREGKSSLAWFGGGADLTPYYLFDDDITAFHQRYQDLCNAHFSDDGRTYRSFKRNCDDYFYLPARSEHRGTGGIFFDDLPASERNVAFVKGVAAAWMPSWLPIVTRRKDAPYTDQQRQWQLLRRGRYLEFNLLYDRGVKFGLANANPRVEGVMVSAPPLIAWEYNHNVERDSDEARLMGVLKQPKEWV